MIRQLDDSLITLVAALVLTGCVSMPRQAHNAIYADASFEVDVTECRAQPKNPSETVTKSLIILPPTGGTNLIDRSYVKRFCKDGYDVYLLNDWSRPGEKGDDLSFHQHAYTNSQHAIRLALNRINTQFIGLIGTSVGATYAEVAANSLVELDAVLFIVGGLPIPHVIVTSDHPSMLAFHKSRFERFKFANDEAYEAAINEQFKLEPTRLGDLHKSKDFAAVIALNDTTVPYDSQKTLVDFFKPRTVITLSSSHVWAVVKTWLFHTGELVDFFNQSAQRKSDRLKEKTR